MKLYRGISNKKLMKDNGILKSKGIKNTYEIMAGNDHVMAGNAYTTINASRHNMAYVHNYSSNQYNSSYISFTTDYDIARMFATNNFKTSGKIFVINIPNEIYDLIIIDEHNQYAVHTSQSEVLVDTSSYDFQIPIDWITEIIEVELKNQFLQLTNDR